MMTALESAHRSSKLPKSICKIDKKLEHLLSMRETLAYLVEACHGDHRPDCPILEDLAAKVS